MVAQDWQEGQAPIVVCVRAGGNVKAENFGLASSISGLVESSSDVYMHPGGQPRKAANQFNQYIFNTQGARPTVVDPEGEHGFNTNALWRDNPEKVDILLDK